MFMPSDDAPEDMKRMQVPMSRKLRDLLRDWAAELSKAKDEEVGVGAAASKLLDGLMTRPELVQELLFADTPKSNTTPEPVPKKQGRRD